MMICFTENDIDQIFLINIDKEIKAAAEAEMNNLCLKLSTFMFVYHGVQHGGRGPQRVSR